MVNPQLPAHLQNRQSRAVNERAAAGIGSSMPPHISIQGNSFTLIDAAGNEQNEGGVIEVCIADVSDVVGKRYMDPTKPWTSDSNDPPLCWSANGLGPSREAAKPQNSICATCPHNERGSAVSKLSGASIKACRDEKWLAVILPKYPTMIFRLVVTPGSFKNWRDFLKPFETHGVDISDTVVRMQFEPKLNGVLQFAAATTPQGGTIWIDEGVFKAREGALLGKATDALVGRNDVPIAAALGAPVGVSLTQHNVPMQMPNGDITGVDVVAMPAAQQPASNPAFGQPAQEVQQPPKTRTRRTNAQMAADAEKAGGALAQQAPFAQTSQAAPFAPQGTPAAQGGFGMAPGAAPDAALANTLNSLFGPK